MAARPRRSGFGLAAGLAAACLLTACTTAVERAERLAAASGFERVVVAGEPFEHVVFIKHTGLPRETFNVYIEGDGTPWLTRHRVSADPTPRRPLMLRLMALDPGRAVYLGRPCYFGSMKHCRPAHWTGERYSGTVVHSMAVALANLRARLDWRGEPALIGHSGGGALAVLLAPRVPDAVGVLTIAANLDIHAWTRLHDYTPLAGSLNPADAPPLPGRLRQLHIVGGRDENVPPRITRSGLRRQPGADVVSFPEQAHHCCWQELWRDILARL